MLIFCTRRDWDETVSFIYVRDETRPRETVSFFTRPRQEPSFNVENDWIFALLYLKTTNPDQDKTEARLSKIEVNETRPRQDCLKICHPGWDRDEKTFKILYETGTRPKVSVLLVLRPRLSPISGYIKGSISDHQDIKCWSYLFWISRLPCGLEIPSWTFFNSPFCVHLRNIIFLCVKFWMRYCQNTKGR